MAGAELLSALAVLASGDFDKVAPDEMALTCPPGTKPQHEGSLEDVLSRGVPIPHRTPWSLSRTGP